MSDLDKDEESGYISRSTPEQMFSTQNSHPISLDKGKVILILTIDIGKGRKEQIQIREHDEPLAVASAFCEHFKLKEKLVPVLAASIDEQIDKLIEEGLSTNTPAKTSPKPCSDSSDNIGCKLYYKGLMMKAQQHLRNLELKKAEEERMSYDLTFTPKINMMGIKSNISIGSPTRSQIRYRLLNKLEDDCTFVPKISDKSKHYARAKSAKRDSIHQELYHEAELRDKRNYKLAEEYNRAVCPFKPDISISKIDYVSPKRVSNLYIHQKDRNQAFESIMLNANLVDPYTGQELFKPRIGRSPKKARNVENLPIGDYLYNARSSGHGHPKETKPRPKPINKWSEKLFFKRKINRYREIFKWLNPDSSGRISADKVIVEKVPEEQFSVLRPFFEEFDEIEEPLYFEQFVQAMDNLLEILNPLDRGILLQHKKEKEPEKTPEQDFMPGIRRRKKSEITRDIYERHMQKLQEKEQKVNHARLNNMIQESSECTFKPRIRYYKAETSITKKLMKSTSNPDILTSSIHNS